MPFEPHPTDPNLVVFKSRKLEFGQHASDYEQGFIDGMQKQMQSSVDKAVNSMGKREWVGLTPLHIEDEYVRNYLWERALIAIDDPCPKNHPHENMNEYCQHKTAQLQKERNT
jgi:hypothetical protein